MAISGLNGAPVFEAVTTCEESLVGVTIIVIDDIVISYTITSCVPHLFG